jgi:hypothetical protein
VFSGRSHDSSFSLFELNETASEGVRIFAETGASDVLDQLSQGEGGIYDEFIAPSVLQGVGSSHANFFVDKTHSKVRKGVEGWKVSFSFDIHLSTTVPHVLLTYSRLPSFSLSLMEGRKH